MDAYRLIRSYDRNGVLGELTDRGPTELDRFFRQEHRALREALQQARVRSAQEKREVAIDCSRLSGVNGGEQIVVDPAGKSERRLERLPEVEAQLTRPAEPDAGLRPCASLQKARPLLARCAYNGLWSPSGTNWQPIRAVELSPPQLDRLAPEPGAAGNGCGLLVLARRRYDSILGDIAGLCGIDPHCHAEDIDLGIWLLSAEQTARAHGWRLESRPLPAEREAGCLHHLRRIVGDRIARLPAAAAEEREAAQRLLARLEAGHYRPHCVLVPRQGHELGLDDSFCGGLRPSAFDRLIEMRSTQRVASPAGELDPGVMEELFALARAFAPGDDTGSALDAIRFPVFRARDRFVEQVGAAMHEAVQGPGGLLQLANHENLKAYLAIRRARQADSACGEATLQEALQRWMALNGEQLERAGDEVALPAGAIPPHVLGKLLEGKLFRQQGEQILDRRGRPITVSLFLNLVRMMLSSFVRFSLGFRNTHPLLGVLLAPASAENERRDRGPEETVYQAMGRAVAHMTLLARARGAVSIIKSGPPEIARDAIRRLLSEHAVDAEIRRAAAGAEQQPILTFQLGLPLGPDDPVCGGQPEEHDGLQERLLDRRAPRAPLLSHYLPGQLE